MKAAIFAKDCLPLPPTPKSKAFPLGCLSTRTILLMCSQASWKSTSFNEFFPLAPEYLGSLLYSF